MEQLALLRFFERRELALSKAKTRRVGTRRKRGKHPQKDQNCVVLKNNSGPFLLFSTRRISAFGKRP